MTNLRTIEAQQNSNCGYSVVSSLEHFWPICKKKKKSWVALVGVVVTYLAGRKKKKKEEKKNRSQCSPNICFH